MKTKETDMSTPHDKDKAGGNSSFGNTQRPADVQGDKPENQAEPRDPAHPKDDKTGSPKSARPNG
jgi:hypothetical protein